MTLPPAVELVEMSLRDGLQDEPTVWATERKVELAERLARAGLRRIELTSFAHPDRVPQMADAEAVVALARTRDDLRGVRLAGLVLNQRSLDRALACEVDEVDVVVLATTTFSERNQGMTRVEATAMAETVLPRARAAGLATTVTISAAFGCPYEGEVDPDEVVALAVRLAASGPSEIALADTIGVADPVRVRDLVGRVGDGTGLPVRVHLHNSRNNGVANALAAIGAGARVVDTSFGGLGGCPFAPGANGNIPTEDLAYLLARMGIDTGIDLDALVGNVGWLEDKLGRQVVGQLGRAGTFPRAER